ncbi:MAG: ATP-binding protein [Deltaproteobacteria bacterium]|nr:MAG: ATP-binding protein [Deltaproteobacteria bacterium]
MQRRLYDDIILWKKAEERKPLILRGARQVGKTYLLEDFGKREFLQTIRLNFERQPNLGQIFERDFSVKRIIQEIEVEFNTKIDPQNTLIIFDEIQQCPKAITSLKYFCEDGRDYFVASAGSLLGLKVGGSSFPVGKIHFLDLYPLNFNEFLLALGEETLVSFLSELKIIEPLSENIHQKCLDYLKLYFCIGGMPEAVKDYVEKRDISRSRELQLDLLETYSNDFSKHAGKTTAIKIQQVWDSIPKQLAREQKKFMFTEIKKGGRSKEYEEAINWLINAKLCHKVQLVKRPEFPLAHFEEEGFFKLILLDVGLLGALSQINPQILFQETDLFKTFKGAFAESFVGQELLCFSKKLFYWRSQHEAEIDYLVERNSLIFPIEVKSGQSGKLKSLKTYSDKYSPKYRIRISSQNYFLKDDFINLPLYGTQHLGLIE